MDDFLHNLRTGKFRRNNTDRRQYDNPQYRGTEKRGGKDRRDASKHRPVPPDRMMALLIETIPAINNFLESYTANQKRLAEIDEGRLKTEDRKADALEAIAECLKTISESATSVKEGKHGLLSSLRTLEAFQETERPVRLADEDRDKVFEIIRELRESGASYERIAQHLDAQDFPTFSGKGRWHGQTVQKLFKQMIQPEESGVSSS